MLGHTTATPMLDAGVSRNVTPPVATAILDVRSTPDWTHEEIADPAALAARLRGGGDLEAARALRDAKRSRLSSRRPPRAPEAGPVREPDLLRLGVPAPGRHQGRPGHQPPLAHAGRVRGSARGHRGARFYGAVAREYLDGGAR